MCIGENAGDTLTGAEQDILIASTFTAYRLDLRDNADGMTWATLVPANAGDVLPIITICRIDPCILVMLEDRFARRQFRSLASVEDAVGFVQDMTNASRQDVTDPPGYRTLH